MFIDPLQDQFNSLVRITKGLIGKFISEAEVFSPYFTKNEVQVIRRRYILQ